MEINGEFAGELRFDTTKFSKALTRFVGKNNESSGKITVPLQHLNEQVIVLFPKKKKKKRT